jgi:hypothetical protein
MPFWCTLAGQFGYGRSVETGFLPNEITGLYTWYDASDLTTMYDATSGGSLSPNGGRVARWLDKTANSYNALQVTGQADTTRPVLTYNAQNNLAALQFSTNESRQLNGATGVYPYDVYMVIQTPITASNFDVMGVGASGSDNFNGFEINSGNVWIQSSTGGARSYTTSPAETSSNFLIMRWTATNATNTNQIWRNGTAIGRANYTWTFPSGSIFRIGNRTPNTATTTRAFNGKIGEILIYDNQPTPINRQLIEGYLAWKWGLQTNLPSSHPFRNYPPTTSPIPFQPTMLSNLQGWFDASDPLGTGTPPADGASVTTWSDKSGWARNTSGGTAGFYSNVDGGMIRFNGTSTNYPIASVAATIANQYFTIFVVERLGGTNATRALFGGSSSTTNANLHNLYSGATSSSMSFGFFGNDLSATTIPAFTTPQPIRIWSFSQRPTFRSIYLNGSNYRTDTNNTLLSGWTGASIGLYTNTPAYYLGNYHEFLMCTGTVTYYQQQQVEGYLAWKWGLQTSLPSSHPFYSASPTTAATAFLPTMLQNLTMWLDASSSNNFSLTASSVNTWFDKSGLSNNMTQATVASKPTFITYESSYAVDFDGTDDFLGSALSVNALINNTNFSIFVIANVNSINTNDSVTFENNDAIFSDRGGNMSMYLRSAGPIVGSYYYDAADIRRSATTTFTLNTTSMFNYTLGGGLIGIRLNGGAITTANAPNTIKTTTGLFDIGRNYGSAAKSLDGQVMEMILYKTTLTDFQRQQTEGYLAWKWGLQNNLFLGHPFRSAAPTTAAIPFSPNMLSNNTLWLDAADTNAFTLSGSSVNTWIDKSGRSNNATQATAGSRPTRVAYGSLNAVDFDGTDDFLETGKAISVFFLNTARSIFVVGLARTVSTNDTTNAYQNDAFLGDRGGYASLYMRSSGPIVGAFNWTGANSIATTTLTLNALTLFNYTLSSSTLGIRLNGGTQTTAASGTTNNMTFTLDIGRQFNNNSYNLNGQIMEVIIYSQDLISAQRQIVEGYLAWKWGFQGNLPAGHPYKNLAPTSANVP